MHVQSKLNNTGTIFLKNKENLTLHINYLFDFTLGTRLFKFQYLIHRWGLELTCLKTGDYSQTLVTDQYHQQQHHLEGAH